MVITWLADRLLELLLGLTCIAILASFAGAVYGLALIVHWVLWRS